MAAPGAAPIPSRSVVAFASASCFVVAARNCMSDSPKPLSETNEHPLQSRVLGGATSTAELIDRAQLAERQGRTQEARQLYEQALSQLRTPAEAPIAASLLRWIGIT